MSNHDGENDDGKDEERLEDYFDAPVNEEAFLAYLNQNDYLDKYEELKAEYKKLEGKLEKSEIQYVTILGIFSSIMLAFVGAFTFSTSVLANMHTVSIERLIFVILCIAFFIINILQGLFDFLLKIMDKKVNLVVFTLCKGTTIRGFSLVNILILTLMFCDMCYSLYHEKNPVSIVNARFITNNS